jgi:hypothetical protein
MSLVAPAIDRDVDVSRKENLFSPIVMRGPGGWALSERGFSGFGFDARSTVRAADQIWISAKQVKDLSKLTRKPISWSSISKKAHSVDPPFLSRPGSGITRLEVDLISFAKWFLQVWLKTPSSHGTGNTPRMPEQIPADLARIVSGWRELPDDAKKATILVLNLAERLNSLSGAD